MQIDVVTIFPSYFDVLELSLLGKAQARGIIDLRIHDLRDSTEDRHRTVDDTPAGGGAGMVMKPEPWGRALDAMLEPVLSAPSFSDVVTKPQVESEAVSIRDPLPGGDPLFIFPTPSGELFTQSMARELATEQHLVFGCGRYEGIDQRVFDEYGERCRVRLVSIGDYVLNGGEVATLAMVEAIARLIPGVVGNPESLVEESHESGLLEYPVYTKPAVWRGREVPAVLLSGNHAAIERWRHERSLERTSRVRPDLLSGDGAAS